MQYKNVPTILREEANPAFHEAIGDLIELSVGTPKHLKKIGLLKREYNKHELEKVNLKHLLKTALNKLALIPYAYALELWRWKLFAGEISYDEANRKFWEIRIELQGVSPPIKRDVDDFDPGAKYHIPANMEYIK